MKHLISLFFIGFVCPCSLLSQNLNIEGSAKITDMELKNTSDSVVVALADGTLARRDVSTLSEFQVLSISNDTIYLNENFTWEKSVQCLKEIF